MTKHEHATRADKPPPVERVASINKETLLAIEERAAALAVRLKRLGVPELQMIEDVGALVRFARRRKGAGG